MQDELLSISKRSAQIIFSHETALFLHGISDRTPFEHTITVPSNYTPSAVTKAACKIYYIKPELFELGKTLLKTPAGNEEDIYGGYRVMLNAKFDTLLTPLSIDVYTGAVITPHAVQYQFSEIFDEEKSYELWAYNIESVMAEKVETILRRGVFNTRPRDFYDAYVLATTQNYDKALFAQALSATANHRGTTDQIADVPGILRNIEESPELRAMWDKYRKQFAYAKDIAYEQIMDVLKTLLEHLTEVEGQDHANT
jgi:hypothetical protein